MKWFILKTKKEYLAAVDRFNDLFDVSAGHKDYEEKELLALFIEKYQKENIRVPSPDPIEFVKTRLEDMCMKAQDLVPKVFSTKSQVSEFLNRKRGLTLRQVKALHELLHIPYDSLMEIPDYVGTRNKKPRIAAEPKTSYKKKKTRNRKN